jgi:hypothetical protein
MAGQNEVSIVLTADATNLKAQLAGARQDIEASVGRSGALGSSLQQTTVLFDQFGRRATADIESVVTSGKKLVSGAQEVARGQADQNKEFGAGVRTVRTLTDAFLGQIPILGSEASALITVLRETRNMSVGFTAGALAVTAAGIVFQKFVEAANKVAEAQVRAKTAMTSGDFAAAQAGLQGMIAEQIASANNWDIIGKKGPASIASISAALRILGGETFSTVTERTVEWAKALDQAWQAFGRVDAAARANLSTLKAEASVLENLKDAASLQGLPAVNAQITKNLKDQVDAEVALLTAEKAKFDLQMQNQIAYLAGEGKILDALKVGRVQREQDALKDQEIAAKRIAGAAAVAKAELDGAQAVAAAYAAQYTQEARLAEIKGAAVQKAIAAAGEELTITQQRVTREAAFNAEALSNIDGYYARRRALVLKAAAEEIASDERVYQQKRRSLLVQAEALPTGSLRQEEIYRQITVLDTQFENGRVDRARQAMTEIRTLEEARVAATQQNNARRFQLEQTYYTQRIALGRASAQEEIEFLRQSAQNAALPLETRRAAEVAFYQKSRELAAQDLAYKKGIGQATVQEEIAHYAQLATAANTSLLERQQAAVQAQALIRAAEQDTFELAQAQGRVTETEAVEHARNIALSWKEGTKQRIDAEKQFATQAKAAWDSLAQAGRSLEDMAITRLAASGRALSQANIAGEISKIKGEASGLNDVWQRGGTLTQEQLTLLRAWSDANAKLATQGQTEYGALRASADQLNNGVHGVVMSVESLAGKGTSVSMFGNALVTASTGATRAATSVEELSDAARRAAEQERLFGQAGDQAFDIVTTSAGELVIKTRELGTQMGIGIGSGLESAAPRILGAVRSVIEQARAEAVSGVGPIGAAFAEAFERRLIQMIDSAANRN